MSKLVVGRRKTDRLFLLFCFVALSRNVANAQTPTATKDATTSSQEDPINITIHKERASTTKQEPDDDHEPPSATTESHARRAATKPVMNKHGDGFRIKPSGLTPSTVSTTKSHRMKDHSLAQQVEYLTIHNDPGSFETLLRLEDERQKKLLANASSKTTDPPISPFFLSFLGSSALLAVSAFVWDPASAKSLWKTVLNKKMQAAIAVAWLPWVWAHPAKLALLDLLILLQFIRQPAMMPFLQYEIMPIIGKTLKTMLLTEIWTRTWKWFFPQWEQLLKFVTKQSSALLKSRKNGSSNNNGKDKTSNSNRYEWQVGHVSWPTELLGEPPKWLVETHKFLVGGVRRGIKSAFKKSAQETILSSLGVWKTALQEQIIQRAAEA